MINLLHLSDLHFGFDRDQTARAQRAAALDLLIKQAAKLQPQVLVISGDLSWQGKPSGYTELADWLTTKLFPATGLTPADCVICPGNHDLDREEASALEFRTSDPKRADDLLRPERLAKGFARPFAEFVKFAEALGIPAPHLSGTRQHNGIQFVTLNSAWFCRDSNTDRGNLWLGLPQLQSMSLCDPDEYDQSTLTVALVHHPPHWLANDEYNAYGNRPNTYSYLAERSHMILSGHTHGEIKTADRHSARAHLFLGGASYDDHEYRNNFSLLQIDPAARNVTRRCWELDPRKPEWEEKKPQHYSLRIEKTDRAAAAANPGKYFDWLRGQTQTIDLNQLKAGPEDIPLPAIDVLYIRLMTAGSSTIVEGREPVALEQALQERKLVIEGKPGGGKTTFVRWLAWMLCRPAGPPPGFPVQGFPLLVRISELDTHIAKTLESRKPGDPTHAGEARWIPHFLAAHAWDLDESFFRQKLEEESTVLMLDGLDEAAGEERRQKMVKMVLETPMACRIVVTTRPGADEGRAALQGFTKARIEDLDDAGIDGFLQQWCRWLKRGNEVAAQEYLKELRQAVAVSAIRLLARNPLMLTALAVLHLRRHRLPQQRAQLYEQIMEWLADQAVEKHPNQWRKDELLNRFGRLALGMQEWKGGHKIQLGIDTAARLLDPTAESIEPLRHFLEQAQIDSGIVTLRGKEIAFWHRSFQEYLAARTLSGLTDANLGKRAKKFLYSPEGREVLPLLAGRMVEYGRQRLDQLFDVLIGDALAQKTLERKAHATGVLGNMLADLVFNEYELAGATQTKYGQLLETVLAIFEKGKARHIDLKTRVDAAEALDQASQSRLPLPYDPKYWVQIPGGNFQIGRYPVTVYEFGKYLDITQQAPPSDWEEQKVHPGRPVTRVSWHDAQSYCKWAGCALPSERQWELAARGQEGREYAWGREEPDEHRANCEMKVGAPSPVGLFSDGSTPEGVADMAGNVWEWTADWYDKEKKYRVLRGGSWGIDSSVLRAAVRLGYGPADRVDDFGFRCVREGFL